MALLGFYGKHEIEEDGLGDAGMEEELGQYEELRLSFLLLMC